jgi:two-component system, NtrC family, response regulator AtoC
MVLHATLGAEPIPRLEAYPARSLPMRRLLDLARRVAAADTALLITGETGVGKERLAKAIHNEGPRARGAFVAVNCAAIPESLFESELFGHVEGAFTGASRSRRGYFQQAHGGTLFLDEVGDMPPHAQAKLLRVLQDHRIRPVGGEQELAVDVRVIAATNRNLSADTAASRFRRDLFYRLRVVTLYIPALRERREDIPRLVEHYREHFARRMGRAVGAVSPDAMQVLCAYDFPGNVRELINIVEHAVLLCTNGHTVEPSDLPELQPVVAAPEMVVSGRGGLVLDAAGWRGRSWSSVKEEVLRSAERAYLESVLRETAGRVGAAARRAGITPRSLSRKMRRSGLDKRPFRDQTPFEPGGA